MVIDISYKIFFFEMRNEDDISDPSGEVSAPESRYSSSGCE